MSKYSIAHKLESSPYIKDLTKWIDHKSHVLDVGCSSGYLGRYLIEEKQCRVDGVEIDENDSEIAKNFLDHVYVFDLDQEWPKTIQKNKYNAIIFADVLEHLKDPGRVLRETKKLLSPDGKIIISIPNIAHISTRLELLLGSFEYEPLGILDETHTKYFTFESATKLLNKSGYDILEIDYTINDLPREVIAKFLKQIHLKPGEDFWREIKTPEARAYQLRFLATPKKEISGRGHENERKKVNIEHKPLQFRDNYIRELIGEIEAQIQTNKDLKEEFKDAKVYHAVKTALHISKKATMPKSYINLLKRLKTIITRKGTGFLLQAGYKYLINFKDFDYLHKTAKLEDWGKRKVRREITKFKKMPKISLIVDADTNPEKVPFFISFLKKQYYSNWELILITNSNLQIPNGNRIKIISREGEELALAFNNALEKTDGEYVAFPKITDSLHEGALFEAVKALQKKDYDFIYSDEDFINERGMRSSPFFKPEWSIDLFLSYPYTGDLNFLKKTSVMKAGGFRSGFDVSSEYDLLLRLIDKINPKNIFHIPKLLYSRIKPELGRSETDKLSLDDYLKRNRIKGMVTDGLFEGSYRIKREIIGNPGVSIIIPFKDKVDFLQTCVESIFTSTNFSNYEIILINNRSIEKSTLDYLEKIKDHKLIKLLDYDNDFNWSAINNFGAKHATKEYLLFLNNDMKIIGNDWLRAMLEHAVRNDVGVVGARLLYPNDTIQHAGVVLLNGNPTHALWHTPAQDPGYFGFAKVIRNYLAVTGACLLTKKTIFRSVKGFDEKLTIAYNDIDYCLRLGKKGFKIIYTPYAELYHYESISRGYSYLKKKSHPMHKTEIANLRHFKKKHPDYKKTDPYFNPNLAWWPTSFNFAQDIEKIAKFKEI